MRRLAVGLTFVLSACDAVSPIPGADFALPDLAMPDLSPPDLSAADLTPPSDPAKPPDLWMPDMTPLCTDNMRNGTETDIDCGGDKCPPCADTKTCQVGSDCIDKVCAPDGSGARVCQAPTCKDGVQNGGESDKDCGHVCAPNLCAPGSACAENDDCTDGVCKMSNHLCQQHTCSDGVQNGDETATDCGGSCNACMDGQACKVNHDCQSTSLCQPTTNKCVTIGCSDGVKDQQETDVDCGGPTCPTCLVGKMCLVNGDCMSMACAGAVCTTGPKCNDGVKDGTESDVDCGAACAPTQLCANGKMCKGAADCTSGVCAGGICQAPTCKDGVKNQGESDVDCGGPCPKCTLGKSCGGNGDCATGKCSSGACVALTLSFASALSYLAGPYTYDIAVGDIDVDGKPDVAVTNFDSLGTNTVTIFRNTGGGNLQQAAAISAPYCSCGGYWSAPLIDSFNPAVDSVPDLVFFYMSDIGTMFTNLGQANFNFSQKSTSLSPSGGPNSSASIDVNGDGYADIVAPGYATNNFMVLTSVGDGTFSEHVLSPGGVSKPAFLAMADFNHDGVPDIAVTNDGAPNITLLNGQRTSSGAYGLTLKGNIAMGHVCYTASVADFNRDGSPDLVVQSGPGVTVLLNDGNGTLVPQSPIMMDDVQWRGLGVGDFNHDGITDVAVTTNGQTGPGYAILMGNGTGGLNAPQRFPLTGAGPMNLAVADMNSDGLPDLVITISGPNSFTGQGTVFVVLNTSK